MTPAGDKLNLSFQLSRAVGGFLALISGEGYITDFELASDIDVESGMLERLDMTHKKINGVMNFKWEVAKDSPGAYTVKDRIKLPTAIEIPLWKYLDGLPLFLEISGALIVNPAVTGGKEYSRGAFRVTFDGYQSFRVKEGNVDADGTVTGNLQFLESQNISALAPMGRIAIGGTSPWSSSRTTSVAISKACQWSRAATRCGIARRSSSSGTGWPWRRRYSSVCR